MPKYIKLEEISLKNSTECNEKWVQQIIADNPDILGLGNLQLKYKEKIQPHAGRLDLLLTDEDDETRYEVEIQLGKTDESHIIRTIEYWDIENNRYPNKDHVAVIVAEDITSRFLNVIRLFNRSIPLIALKMTAFKQSDGISLTFTKVLDWQPIEDENEDSKEVTDRTYWESHSTKNMLKLVDELLTYVQEIAPGYQLNYNKYYVGLTKDGISKNFVYFKPRKQRVILHAKITRSEEIEKNMQGIDYDWKGNFCRIYLDAETAKEKKNLIVDLIQSAAELNRALDQGFLVFAKKCILTF